MLRHARAQVHIFYSDEGESFEVAYLRFQIGRSGGETDGCFGSEDDGILCGLKILVCMTDWNQGVY